MRHTSTTAALTAALTLACAAPAFPQARLQLADKAQLLDCGRASSTPAFRLRANVVDAEGAPVGLPLPPAERLAQAITIDVNARGVEPFYAAAGADDSSNRRRVAMLLIDASGSMLAKLPSGQTRFEGAKAAASRFLQDFEPGSDEVAVVPFESRSVVPTIRAAVFARTLEAAQAQVAGLPTPEVSNNTALYSAVDAALTVLAAHDAGGDAEKLLIVLTDGRNDVRAGDDPGLLGDEGLPRVAQRVAEGDVEVVGVGLGDGIDQAAMRQISTRFHQVSDLESLARVFSFARELLLSRLHVAFFADKPDRASLAGENIEMAMTLRLDNGQEITGAPIVWAPPQMGSPTFDGECAPAELKAAMEAPADPATEGGFLTILRPILVFLGLGAVLLVLWFWVPRLVWPEQYVGDAPVVPTRGRWTSPNETRVVSGGVRADAPPGFSPQGRGAPGGVRAAGDKTVVAPRAPGTETRLSRNDPRNR